MKKFSVFAAGLIITILFGLLFLNSIGWKWKSGSSRSFSSGSVHYHKSSSIDLGWSKIVFYPFVVSGILIGFYAMYLGISYKEDE